LGHHLGDTHGWELAGGHPWVGGGWLEDTHGLAAILETPMGGGWLEDTHGWWAGWATLGGECLGWGGSWWHPGVGRCGVTHGLGHHFGDTHGWGLAGGHPWVGVGWRTPMGWPPSWGYPWVGISSGWVLVLGHPWVGMSYGTAMGWPPSWRHPWVPFGRQPPTGGHLLWDTHGWATLGPPTCGHLHGVEQPPSAHSLEEPIP